MTISVAEGIWKRRLRLTSWQPIYAHNADLRARAFSHIGYTYRQMKQPVKAKEGFERSLQALPNQPAIHVQLGLIAQLGGDPAEAVRQFTHAMRLQPTDVGMLLLANALLEEGKTKESDIILKRAEGLSKDIDAAEKQAQSLLRDD